MDRYKKKVIAFGNVEEKRNLRFIRKSVDRSNIRYKRLSELRKLEESTLDELPDEKTPAKAVMPSETHRQAQANLKSEKSQSSVQQEPKKMTYREKLQKWKEEKELKKQLEARKKIPVFKVGRLNLEQRPASVPSVATSKNKEPVKFVPKLAQPSRVALKPPVNSRDVPKPVGKVAPKPAPVSAVSRLVPNPKEGLRAIPITRNNSRPQPASNPGTKPAVMSFRPTVKLGNPGTKTSSTSNSTVSSVANSSISRGIKPPSSNICAPKQIAKPQSVTKTTVASKIPNQRTGIASRIVPPCSCNKEGTTVAKTNASADSGLKAPQQKKVPAPKVLSSTVDTKANVEKQTKSVGKDEDIDLMDSFCEEKSSVERKKSFAPDDYVFKAPDMLSKFAFPFGNSNFIAMYADMVGVTLPGALEDKTTSKSENQEQKEDPKEKECKSDVPVTSSSKISEEDKNVAEEVWSVPLPTESSKLLEEDKNVAAEVQSYSPQTESSKLPEENENLPEEVQNISPPTELSELPEENVAESVESISTLGLKDSNFKSDKMADLPAEENTQKSKEKIQDLPLYRQLRTISENSPLATDWDLEDSFSGEKSYRLRRSRRLASNHFAGNESLEPKYFQKTKRPSATSSDYLSPLLENPPDSPLTSQFSGLNVDSPSDIKQYNFRVRKPEQENRVSLLGSPVRPHVGPRKSVKGDLICFTP